MGMVLFVVVLLGAFASYGGVFVRVAGLGGLAGFGGVGGLGVV